MKKYKFENHRDIFKHFSILDLEKTERVLVSLKGYVKKNPVEGFLGVSIENLKCEEDDVKTALPILEAIRNNLFKPKEMLNSKNSNVGAPQTYMPTQEVTITRDKKLTGLYLDDIIVKSLEEIQLYLSKNKTQIKGGKIHLILANIGLRNEQNGEVYPIKGKRRQYIIILKNEGPLTAKGLGKMTNQDEKDVFDAIQEINKLAMEKLDLIKKLIISSAKGYALNPLYKITI